MTHDEFLKEVLRTANTEMSNEAQILNCCLGISGESGELIDILKKGIFHKHEVDMGKITKEMGDVLFYLSWLGHCLGIGLDEAQDAVVAKLRARYPEGFSAAASINRPKE